MRTFGAVLVLGAVLLPAEAFRRAAPAPLAHTFETPEALATAVVGALERRDLPMLQRVALSEREFRDHVWPELPASRPERNMPLDYVWGDLETKSRGYLRATLQRPLVPGNRIVRVEFDGAPSRYGGVSIHRKAKLVLRDDHGRESTRRLFGSVVEQGGRYKVFSFITD